MLLQAAEHIKSVLGKQTASLCCCKELFDLKALHVPFVRATESNGFYVACSSHQRRPGNTKKQRNRHCDCCKVQCFFVPTSFFFFFRYREILQEEKGENTNNNNKDHKHLNKNMSDLTSDLHLLERLQNQKKQETVSTPSLNNSNNSNINYIRYYCF